MTYPPQQPQDWGGQQPYDPNQQGYGQQPQPGFDQQLPSYDLEPQPGQYQQDPYAQPPVDPYQPPQPSYDPAQYSAPPVSVAPASGQPYGGGPMLPPAAPKSSAPVWIFIVGGVVLLALIGVGVFFAIKATGTPSDDKSDSANEKSDEPSDDPPSASASPNGDMIVDTNTGLGFKSMSGWQTMDTSAGIPVPGFTSFQGQQYEVTTDWVAMLGVGEIDTSTLGYKDSGDLKDTVKALAKEYDKNNFGKDPKGLDRDVKAEYDDADLAGKKAITMAYHLTWDKGENPDTGEQIVIAVIDVGGGKAAGFLGSLPDSTPKDQVDVAVEAAGTLAFS